MRSTSVIEWGFLLSIQCVYFCAAANKVFANGLVADGCGKMKGSLARFPTLDVRVGFRLHLCVFIQISSSKFVGCFFLVDSEFARS